ncbi:acyltransferase [Novosphingobium sp. ZN18A2]|uniref:acyltransferase family protein n=1 Tax=Novosphingobium sp. ZN18A2 TaxID=3079861 RepID=UPI0030D3714A
MNAQPRHLDALTGIRGIAAWAVVLYHVRLSLTGILPADAIAVLGRGYLAVDLFFILSGFVIWYNYADRLATGGARRTGEFLWRRFARIWPLHATMLAAFATFAAMAALSGRPNPDMPFAQLPLQLLLIQNWGFTAHTGWNVPAWSISTEFAAYLAFPGIVLIASKVRRPATRLLLAAALAAAIQAIFSSHGYRSLGDDISGLGLVRCLVEFSLGTIACMIWRASGARTARAWPWVLAAAGWGTLGLVLGWPQTAVIPLFFTATILALASDTGPVSRILSVPAVVWLGEVSYSTYLSHTFLFLIFKLLFVDETLQVGWAGLAAYLLIVLATSALLYRLVERPAQRWLNARAPRWAAYRRPLPAN